jgi:XTP/dITP diphosphohydrolase
MKKIVIATSNKHKVSEISAKIQPFFDEILSLADFPEIGEIVEDGNTIEENSFIKSRASFDHTKIASVADDTILEVDALDGDPGLFTARYAGENASYEDNMSKLLTELNDVEDKFRTARFKTVITFVDGIKDFCVEGKIEGKILNERIGNNGFGYDPIFLSKEFNISLAEMDNNLKNRVSHRAIAIEKFINKIKNIKK